MTDICKKCGCDKSLTNDKDCPICPFGGQGEDILTKTINRKSVVITSSPDPDINGRSMVLITGDNDEMKDLIDELIAR